MANTKKGLVIKSTGSFYRVKTEQSIIDCKIRGKFRKIGFRSTNPVAVGDFVWYDYDEKNKLGIIKDIEDRKNYIVRKSINLSKQIHIIAANVDVVFLVVTLSVPETTTMFIDRFLLGSEAYHIPVVLLFNKMDLYEEEDIERINYLISVYNKIGYECKKVSAITGNGLDYLTEKMTAKVCAFAGHSGVGKSSLVKAINKDIELKIEEISDIHLTGKHTTTFAEMYEWKKDSYIIDTPGIKAFGLIDIEKEEIAHYFPDIFKISTDCKFQNCTHSHEPQCAVKKAVESNEIEEFRYYNYLQMLEDEGEKHRLSLR